MAMLHKIANREGFGDIPAEGVMLAGQKLSGEAVDIGVYHKKAMPLVVMTIVVDGLKC